MATQSKLTIINEALTALGDVLLVDITSQDTRTQQASLMFDSALSDFTVESDWQWTKKYLSLPLLTEPSPYADKPFVFAYPDDIGGNFDVLYEDSSISEPYVDITIEGGKVYSALEKLQVRYSSASVPLQDVPDYCITALRYLVMFKISPAFVGEDNVDVWSLYQRSLRRAVSRNYANQGSIRLVRNGVSQSRHSSYGGSGGRLNSSGRLVGY